MRNLRSSDIDRLKEIHEKFYDFPFPDFDHNFVMQFVEEQNDKIVLGGGVRLIAEGILITDLDASVWARKRALLNALQCMIFTAGNYNIDQIHAFVKAIDVNWVKALKQQGFQDCDREALYLNI